MAFDEGKGLSTGKQQYDPTQPSSMSSATTSTNGEVSRIPTTGRDAGYSTPPPALASSQIYRCSPVTFARSRLSQSRCSLPITNSAGFTSLFTPAMEAGIADHVWELSELLA